VILCRLQRDLEGMRGSTQRTLDVFSRELYSKEHLWIMEVIQNADDNTYPPGSTPTLSFDVLEDGLQICNNEVGFSRSNVEAISHVAMSSKSKKGSRSIGEKGVRMQRAPPPAESRKFTCKVQVKHADHTNRSLCTLPEQQLLDFIAVTAHLITVAGEPCLTVHWHRISVAAGSTSCMPARMVCLYSGSRMCSAALISSSTSRFHHTLAATRFETRHHSSPHVVHIPA
jgi:hypothetical protein